MPVVYPIATDLFTFLTSTGITFPATLDLARACAQAADDWERATGYQPFLTATATRFFDPPGPERGNPGNFAGYGTHSLGGSNKLFLDCGLIAVNALHVNLSSTDRVGTTLVEGNDFWLRPNNALLRHRGYTWVEFRNNLWGEPKSIQIDAPWGCVADLAQATGVFNVILQRAAAILVPQLALLISQGTAAIKRQDFDVRYVTAKTTPLAAEKTMWDAEFLRFARTYRFRP